MTSDTATDAAAVIPLACIRHAETAWNVEKRFQGQRDIPVSEQGRLALATWHAPSWLDDFDWLVSPLGRTTETARHLAPRPAVPEPRLIEMNWGDWEGVSRAELKQRLGPEELARREAKGLYLDPPGGETPAAVQARLQDWLVERGRLGRPTVAVTHRGVIRALLGIATGWAFQGEPPAVIPPGSLHLFDLRPDGGLAVRALDLSLIAGGSPDDVPWDAWRAGA